MLLSGNFKGLQHIGLPVSDLARSREFYGKLGFREVMTAQFALDGQPGHVAMMQREAVVVELYQMPEKYLADIRARNDGHIDHVAFSVADVDAAYAELKAAGLAPLEPEPVFLNFWKAGCRFFVILGPDGERLEFNQIL